MGVEPESCDGALGASKTRSLIGDRGVGQIKCGSWLLSLNNSIRRFIADDYFFNRRPNLLRDNFCWICKHYQVTKVYSNEDTDKRTGKKINRCLIDEISLLWA